MLRNFLPPTLLFLLLTACAPSPNSLTPETPYPLSKAPSLGEIVHLPSGILVSEPQMLAVATDARIVYVGETHDNPASHRQELTLLKALHERYPGKLALGMEMFNRRQQEVLNRWSKGELSVKEFLRQSAWYRTWKMDFDYYRGLLEFARDNRIPVVGLNAEKDLVAAVRQKDFPQLTEDDHRQLPDMDLDDPYQQALVKAILGDHGRVEKHGRIPLDGFHRAQTLWDETMAESVARYLSTPEHQDDHMLVVAGGNHISYGFGIPRRVFRRLPTSYVLIGNQDIVIPESKKDRLMNIRKPDFPMPPYDFVRFTEYEDLGKEEVKLGVLLADMESGVRVDGVIPGSVAATVPLEKGDVLLALDDIALQENFDLIYEVKQKKPGDRSTLLIRRGEDTLQLEVEFAPLPEGAHHGAMGKE